MTIELLLSTVQPTGVGVACPAGGDGTSPETQPRGAASPASSPATQGSARVKWLNTVDNTCIVDITGGAAAHNMLLSLPHFIKKKEELSR